MQPSGAFSAGQAYIGGRNDNRSGSETQVRWSGVKEVSAELVRLDDILPTIKNLSLIKADIEGAELFAFRGAENMIDHYRPSVIWRDQPLVFGRI